MSFIGVLGSKTGVSKDLIDMMPPEAFGACYLELFAGGAGVFFSKEPARINVLNDCDPDLTVMYRAIKQDYQAVEAELQSLLDDDSLFHQIVQLRDSAQWEDLREPLRAAYVIFVLKQSFNSNRMDLASSGKTRSSFNPNLLLAQYATKLEKAQIRHLNYAKCLDVYLYGSSRTEAFVFADPPYVVTDRRLHYRFNFHPVEHIRFWHRMTRLSKANSPKRNVKIMITYDDVPLIRSLYRKDDGWRIQPLRIGYKSARDSSKFRSEIVITNYCPAEMSAGSPDEPDWSDVPTTAVTMGDVPFAEFTCCEKERAALICQGKRKGKCRVCGTRVVLQ